MRLVLVECVDKRERERGNHCAKNDPLDPIGAVMCSSSSGPHCQFITGRRDSSPSVTGTNNKGQNIVQITRSSRNDFWSTTSGVASLDFLDELNSLLRHMLHSTQNDGIERVEFGPTTQSSMQDSNSNDGQCRLHESGFVATMKENNPYWEANLDQERVIQVDVYDGHPAGGMFLSLSNRTGPIIQKLDEIYDLEEAPGHTWIKLLPDECEMIFVDTSGDRKVRRRVCRYHVERHFKDEVGIIRLGVEGFEQLRLGRVDVWVSRTNRFNRFLHHKHSLESMSLLLWN